MKNKVVFLPLLLAAVVLIGVWLSQSTDVLPDWHFDFAEVRAYRMNWDEFEAHDVLVARDTGELNPTREPLEGIKLTPRQVRKLRGAVTGQGPAIAAAFWGRTQSSCFWPHHAFAFFDEAGQLVGHIDICFHCNTYAGSPEGFARIWHLRNIHRLCEELGLPIRNPEWGGCP